MLWLNLSQTKRDRCPEPVFPGLLKFMRHFPNA
jgi:hypothetical protein